jgi:enediyne polyketide synthase
MDGIAIVGLGCRYPDARSPGELWENVVAGRRAFRRLPAQRLRLEDYYSTDPTAVDSIYSREAAVIEGYEFDRVRFRVAGRTYRSVDLTHWLALDVAAAALADAGFADGDGLPREASGVLVGNTLTGEFSRANVMRLRWPYVRRVVAAELGAIGWDEAQQGSFLGALEASYKSPYPEMTEESLAGGLSNTIAGRIANHFDLGGGGYTVDGACASSLLAVCQACSALAAGDLDVALAGGVDLSIDPFELVGFARAGALAPDEMRVYDQRSSGFIPGEGCGFAVLMRAGEAERQGRRTYAIIRGWGVSSDGAGGLTRPEVEGQLRALRRAYRRAGFGAERVGLFEGHGTGTPVGDAVELEALSRLVREAGGGEPRVPVGSVKANIGHTKAAAGAAALIKTALAVHHRLLPPITGCEEAHPLLAGAQSVLRALLEGEAWPSQPPVAGVSAMGFGGINTHVVLEGALRPPRRRLEPHELRLLGSAQDVELFCFAGSNRDELARHLERVAKRAEGMARAELGDLAAELARRDTGARLRAALVAGRPQQLAEGIDLLRRWLAEGAAEGVAEGTGQRSDVRRGVFLGQAGPGRLGGAPRLGLLFPGQGSPSHLDGGALARRFPVAADLYREAALPQGGDGVDTAVAQPAILAASLAAARVLATLGIEGAVAVGHSVGELAALAWAGALSDEAAVRIARRRGATMAALNGTAATLGGSAEAVTGGMASLAMPLAAAHELALATGVTVAAHNGPRRVVVSGELAAVEAAIGRAAAEGIEAVRLKVSHAFHSPLVAAAAAPFAASLAEETLGALHRPVASTVTGGLFASDARLGELLVRQVTAPVLFAEALDAVAAGVDLWLEVGPGRALSVLAADMVDRPVVAIDAGGPSLHGLLSAVAGVYCLGLPVDAAALFAERFHRPFDVDREPRFFVNPCELAPVNGVSVAVTAKAVGIAGQPAAAPLPAAPLVAASGHPPPSIRELLRELIATRAELPASAVHDDSRLLSDLHLNSISVGQLVVEASRRLGLRSPASPTDFANATLRQVADALAAQGKAPDGAAEAAEDVAPAGVDSWVRPFVVDWVSRPLPPSSGEPGAGAWTLFHPEGHPLAASIASTLARVAGGGVALVLPPQPDAGEVDRMLAAARAAATASRFVVVHHGSGGGGLARSFHRENPGVTTVVVDVPPGVPEAAAWVAAEAAAAHGYVEARYDADGHRREPVLRLLAEGPASGPPLGPGDVLLVTGGGKGITAECALALARRWGVRLALMGRSRLDADRELAANLDRLAAAEVTFRYLSADVADAAAVAAAVAELEAELGPVTAILHGAGRNVPQLLASLTAEEVRATLAPKLDGLANVLAAVDPERLALLVAFGSIIARTGMEGEAHYATANEWLAARVERFAATHPRCRTFVLEWSAWAGVGMGERLGRLEALRRQGVVPIAPAAGVDLMGRLLEGPTPTAPVVATGRFGHVPTLRATSGELPLWRFLERPRLHVPRVELIVDATLDHRTDPYLGDHVFRGEPLLPAVVGLEAMAQAASALLGTSGLPVFEDVVLARPVVIPADHPVTLRVAALAHGALRAEVSVRSDATRFQADCFRATLVFPSAGAVVPPAGSVFPTAGSASVDGEAPDEVASADEALGLDPARDLYGSVLFHRGRFQRLASYRHLEARTCGADLSGDGGTSWFVGSLPGELLLGSPGRRDAALHGIQACVPHATILPTGVDRIVAGRLDADAPLRIVARQRSRVGDDFVYDLTILDAGERVVERWEGLGLRAVERRPARASWPLALLGPYVDRRLEELVPAGVVRVLLTRRHGTRREASDDALRRLTRRAVEEGGAAAGVHRRADGKPEVLGGLEVSVAHAGGLLLAVAGQGPVGCDLEPVSAREPALWDGLLGYERRRLADAVVAERGESLDAAATRVWTAVEALKKATSLPDSPLVLAAAAEPPAADAAADGWLLLRSGALDIATLVTAIDGESELLAIAVLVGQR